MTASIAQLFYKALCSNELSLEYQPIVRLSDHTVVGYEALIRWHRFAPNEFLPDVAESGLMPSLNRFVIDRAVERLSEIRDEDIKISVNLSELNISDHIDMILKRYQVESDRLVLEINEKMPLTQAIIDEVKRVRSQGVGVWLDDWGTGLATPKMLLQLPCEGIKLDRFFVQGIEGNKDKQICARATLEAARAMELNTVIAEGVETFEQRGCLVELGYELGQGYLFG